MKKYFEKYKEYVLIYSYLKVDNMLNGIMSRKAI